MRLLFSVVLLIPLLARAEELPTLPQLEEGVEPEVTIIHKEESMVEEFRLNGELFMVKITPSRGYPYYLIDTDGDGSFETRRNELDAPAVVQWRLFSW